jgi:hypothetical protein
LFTPSATPEIALAISSIEAAVSSYVEVITSDELYVNLDASIISTTRFLILLIIPLKPLLNLPSSFSEL